MAAEEAFPIDVGDDDFEAQVLERSRQTPVVVDFWAPWCGPCRNLGPVLDSVAREYAGQFVLAKVNVDEAPAVAQQIGARSIPMVVAFRDGAIVSEFVGAQPESAVRRFVEAILPSAADRLAREADARAADGDPEAAETGYRAALAEDPHHARGLLGLARVLAGRGETEEAQALLERVAGPAGLEGEAAHLAAELRTLGGEAASAAGEDEAELRRSLAEDPDDLEARLALGRCLAAQRRMAEALPELLAVVKRDRSFADEAARKTMLDIFEVLGPDDESTQQYRAELARALFR